MGKWVAVCKVSDVPTGGKKVVHTSWVDLVVCHVDGNYYAIEDVCTHDGGELGSGRLEGDVIICPRHGARFCVRDGRVLSPPAYEDVSCFPVRIHDGKIEVWLETD